MKDILAAQFESQALQAELMKTLHNNSITDKFPRLPKLAMKADWPKFWLIVEHCLTKPKYYVSKGLKLTHVINTDKFNNVKALGFVDDALVGVLDGDTLKKFLFTKDEYTGKCFK